MRLAGNGAFQNNMKKFAVIICISFFGVYSLWAADVQITGKELGAGINAEYNRSFNFCGDFSAIGSVTLNDHYVAQSGLALGWLGNTFDIKAFGLFRLTSLPFRPLKISLLYNYYGLPAGGYNIHTHTILPYISLNWKWAGISLGAAFRYTFFFDDLPVFESMLSFSGYVNFILREKFRMGLKIANFDNFYIRNVGAYYLGFFGDIRINKNLSVVNELDMYQAGSVALSASFYGIAYRGGVRYSW